MGENKYKRFRVAIDALGYTIAASLLTSASLLMLEGAINSLEWLSEETKDKNIIYCTKDLKETKEGIEKLVYED